MRPGSSRLYGVSVLCSLVALILLAPGCLVRRIKVIRPGVASNAKLQTASLASLVSALQNWDQQIRTLTATVDMEPSIGSVAKGEVSEFKEVRGYILIRKPNMIRLIGQYPVVRNRAFDMVSNGNDFKLYIPAKNAFVIGLDKLEQRSPKKLENLRPQHIFEALIVAPPTDGERPVLENDTDEVSAEYVLHMLEEQAGQLLLTRNIVFDRVSLRVTRQEVFNAKGDMVSDTRYSDYQNVHGIPFPKVFTVMRPLDEYGVKITVEKVELNTQLGDDKFALERPAGTELLNLSGPQPAAPAPGSAPPKHPGGAGGQ